MLQKWSGTTGKATAITKNFGGGINTFLSPNSIDDSEATDMSNVCSEKYPAITTTQGIRLDEGAGLIGKANGLFVGYDNSVFLVDGIWLKLNNVVLRNVISDQECNFCKAIVGGEKSVIISNSVSKVLYDYSSGNCVELAEAPESNLFCAHKNRLFWLKDNQLIFSALGRFDNYSLVNDSGVLNIAKDGQFTGIVSFDDKLFIFSENNMAMLYGETYDDFRLFYFDNSIGCLSQKSIVICNNVMYWVSQRGIYKFSGDYPMEIGTKIYPHILNAYIKASCATDGRNVYFSLFINNGNRFGYSTYSYDTKIDRWYKYSSGRYCYLQSTSANLIGIPGGGVNQPLVNIVDYYSPKQFEGVWHYITKAFSNMQKSTVSDVCLTLELPQGSDLSLYYSTSLSKDDFSLIKTIYGANDNVFTYKFIVPPEVLQDVDCYRFKFYGNGPCTIHSMTRTMRTKRR